ncbi:MAG: hypothetical protein KatS3mg002_0379 [Candidatus Woesearchaeota archaeon]|nr:MAG: hypothetical protein KatS3mg002_0379 [Candidatus Woesearchaeota archaeon]
MWTGRSCQTTPFIAATATPSGSGPGTIPAPIGCGPGTTASPRLRMAGGDGACHSEITQSHCDIGVLGADKREGFPTPPTNRPPPKWAEYALEVEMASNADKLSTILERVVGNLQEERNPRTIARFAMYLADVRGIPLD